MSVVARHGLWRALTGILLLCISGLAACSPEMQARSAAAGTSASAGRLEDWDFGGQSMQPGYLYNQHSLGATGPQYRGAEVPAREQAASIDFAAAVPHSDGENVAVSVAPPAAPAKAGNARAHVPVRSEANCAAHRASTGCLAVHLGS
jgi:hypothetical protein